MFQCDNLKSQVLFLTNLSSIFAQVRGEFEKKELKETEKTFKISMKLLALFLALLTVVYLLPFSVFAENVTNDAVNPEEIECFDVSDNSEEHGAFALAEASTPSAGIVLTLTSSYVFETTDNETSTLISQYVSCISSSSGTSSSTTYKYTYDENGNITEIRKPNTEG